MTGARTRGEMGTCPSCVLSVAAQLDTLAETSRCTPKNGGGRHPQ
jgi:hypothetical protein